MTSTLILCPGVTSGGSHMMSGILKRKLEEGPSPYLSLQGSDDEVSCSDSGNSSDSLNHPVPSGLLDCKITLPHCSCASMFWYNGTHWKQFKPHVNSISIGSF